jgi:sugar/nucleoside kinase (ribokinase family)
MAADFLAVGHVVKDVTPTGGWRLGGSVAYASLQAQRLGLQTVAVTACSPDVSPAELLPHTQWHVLPDEQTTTFHNTYRDGVRTQVVIERARTIGAAQIPERWRSTPIVLFAPVFGDVDAKAASVVPAECLVGLSCQGWLREMRDGRVQPRRFEADAPWLIGDIVFVSDEDLHEPQRGAEWLKYVPMVVLTHGPGGATIFDDDGRHDYEAFRSLEIDPTGAGDVFATAFLVRWKETSDREEAARFAAAAASLAVQGVGLEAVPTRAQIDRVLAANAAEGQRR